MLLAMHMKSISHPTHWHLEKWEERMARRGDVEAIFQSILRTGLTVLTRYLLCHQIKKTFEGKNN